MEKQVTLYDNHDNWKVILIDEKKVVLYNKCDGVVDVVKKNSSRYERHIKCPVCHRDMPSPPSPVNSTNPMADNIDPMTGNPNMPDTEVPLSPSPNYFQLLWSSTSEDEGLGRDEGIGLNAGYYRRFFQEVSKIGSGGFGSVYKCRHVINGINLGEYAIKKVPMGSNPAWQQRVFAEVQNLQRLQQHPNIIGYKHAWMEQDQPAHFGPPVPCLFILMEYANGGNLEDYIGDHYLSDQEVWRIFVDLCQGLGYLHHCGIMHRDIKCNNILLSNTFDAAMGAQVVRVLISDFGTSADIFGAPPAKRTGNTGTVEYLAPELLGMNARGEYTQYTNKCDMWALGVLLYKICFAQFPFPSANLQDREIAQVLREISTFEGISVPSEDRARDPRLIELILQLLSKNPLHRPSVSDILQRPYVQAMIYTPPSPIHSSTPPPSSSSSSSSSLRLRRSHTATYPLLMDAQQLKPLSTSTSSSSSSSPPVLLPAPPQLALASLLTSFPLSLASLLTSFSLSLPPFSRLLYAMTCVVHVWWCFVMFSPVPPPLLFVLPAVGGGLLGFMVKRSSKRKKVALALVFIVHLLWQVVAYYKHTNHHQHHHDDHAHHHYLPLKTALYALPLFFFCIVYVVV